MSKSAIDLKDFKKQLAGLETKVRNKLIRTSLRAAAKVVASEIKARSPVASGDLKRDVKVKAGRRKKDTISIDVVVGGNADDPHVGFNEFGRKGQIANPYIRQSVAAKQDEAVDTIVGGIEEALGGG